MSQSGFPFWLPASSPSITGRQLSIQILDRPTLLMEQLEQPKHNPHTKTFLLEVMDSLFRLFHAQRHSQDILVSSQNRIRSAERR